MSYERTKINFYGNFYRTKNHKRFRTTHKVGRKCSFLLSSYRYGFMLLLTISSNFHARFAKYARAYLFQEWLLVQEEHARVGTCANAALRAYKGNGYVDGRERERDRQRKAETERGRETRSETEKGISMHTRDPDSSHPRNANLSEFAGTRKIIRPIEFRYAV